MECTRIEPDYPVSDSSLEQASSGLSLLELVGTRVKEAAIASLDRQSNADVDRRFGHFSRRTLQMRYHDYEFEPHGTSTDSASEIQLDTQILLQRPKINAMDSAALPLLDISSMPEAAEERERLADSKQQTSPAEKQQGDNSKSSQLDQAPLPIEVCDRTVEHLRKTLVELKDYFPSAQFDDYVKRFDAQFEALKRLRDTLSVNDYAELEKLTLKAARSSIEAIKSKIALDQEATMEKQRIVDSVEFGLRNFNTLRSYDPYRPVDSDRLTRNTVWEAASNRQLSEIQRQALYELARVIGSIGTPVERRYGFPSYSAAGTDYAVSRYDLEKHLKHLGSK